MYECVFVCVWCTCSSLFDKLDWMERLNVILVLVCCVFVHGIWCIRHIRGCYEYSLNERKEETKKKFPLCLIDVYLVGLFSRQVVLIARCSRLATLFAYRFGICNNNNNREKKGTHTESQWKNCGIKKCEEIENKNKYW